MQCAPNLGTAHEVDFASANPAKLNIANRTQATFNPALKALTGTRLDLRKA